MKSLSLSRPHAIIMVGIPGSGKTFFSKKFSETFHAPRVALEDITPHAASLEAAAELARQQVEELLKTGQSVILELSTEARQNRTELAKLLRDHGYEPLFVWVQTDNATAMQRAAKSSGHTAESFEAHVKRFSAPHLAEKPVVISGKHTYATQAKIILKRLSAPRAEISTHSKPPTRSISVK